MTKSDAIILFDGVPNLAAAIGITPQSIYQWREELSPRNVDRVVSALVRTGRLPAGLGSQLLASGSPPPGGAPEAGNL